MDTVRVRFAPSPTGPLHIGGVRTALFNYLLAKKYGGTFILRIEDTDSTRFVPGAEEYINESLKWLGIKVDEGVLEGGPYGPYKQSERREIYKQYADMLFENGWAYYAFDTPEELNALREKAEAEGKTFAYDVTTRGSLKNSLNMSKAELEAKLSSSEPYVMRFKIPEYFEVEANDLIRGKVVFHTNILDDKVLYKSADELPTYHLANVVDDHLMKVTHVIRGEEWLPSLPLHILMYRAFGWEDTMPAFAHLPLILKPSGKGKLSKRDGDKEGFPVFPLEYTSPSGEISSGYRESGYFPEAVVNLLALLGWNPGTEQEIFSMEELAEIFSLERVNKAGARFDPAKARWFNQQYLIKKSDGELAGLFMPYLKNRGIETDLAFVEKVVALVKERVHFVAELWEQSFFFFEAPVGYDEKVVQKRWKGEVPGLIAELRGLFASEANWDAEELKHKTSALLEAKGLGFGAVANALRLAMTGGAFGPDLFTIIGMLGKDEVLRRLDNAVAKLGYEAV